MVAPKRNSRQEYNRSQFKEKVINEYSKRSSKTYNIDISGDKMKLNQDKMDSLISCVKKELKKSEDSLADKLGEIPSIKKSYLDMQKNSDPFYVDYNLLFSNVDLMMSISYSNTMKAVFGGANEADLINADILTKCAEYDYYYEMDMGINEYIAGMEKHQFGVALYIFDGWKDNNSPKIYIPATEDVRFDPNGWGHEKNFRWIGLWGRMTKQQMRDAGFINVDNVIQTTKTETNTGDKEDKDINEIYDESDDETALFRVYHHFRTDDFGNKQLITLGNNNSLLLRAIDLDYMIGDRFVLPISLDYWKPQRGNPYGIRPYDLTGRKQNALSLLLNLGLKKAIRSSLGNHILVDQDAVVNKDDLKQLSEFPEIILVNTNRGQISLDNAAREITRSQVPQDNFNMFSQLEQLNMVETSIGANQMGISPTGEQTAEEIRTNSENANTRLSLPNRIQFNFYQDFWRKWYMMYEYHFPSDGSKLVTISQDYGDRYMTFSKQHLHLSQDPHIKIVSKLEEQIKGKQHLANHIAIHTYLEQFANILKTNLGVRNSLRQLLREMDYTEDQIYGFVQETLEEIEAKDQLILINRGVELEPLKPDQVWEEHEVYLQIFKQAKDTKAKQLAIRERLTMLKKRKELERKEGMTSGQIEGQASNALNSVRNQMTSSMINQNNSAGSSLQNIKM